MEFVYCRVMQVELQKVDTQNAWASMKYSKQVI